MTRPAAFVFRDNLAALATCRELGHAGIDVVVLDARPGPAAHSRFARFVEVPAYYEQPAAWVSAVCELARTYSEAPVLFPTEDAALLVCDRYHAELSTALRFPHPAPGVASAALDKRRLYEAGAEVGLAVPRFYEPGDPRVASEIADGGEWLAKPVCRYWFDEERERMRTFLSLTGGSKAIAGDPRTGAERITAAGFPAIIQERIPGAFEDLVSVGLALDAHGELLGSFCAAKHCEYPEPFGDGLIVEAIAPRPELVEASIALLRRLRHWGICDVEFKRDPRDGLYKLLDANPRVWLWMGLGARCGIPLALTAYLLAIGQPPAPRPARAIRTRGPVWVSPRGAAAFLARSYRPSRHGLGLPMRLTLGALRTILGDLRTFRDPIYVHPSAWSEILAAAKRRAVSSVTKRSL